MIWKDIPGYEGLYQVSSDGKVRSLDREQPHSRYGTQKLKGKELYQSVTEQGYHYVKLCKGNNQKTHRVNVLVYESFIGKRKDGYVVDHIENDRRFDNSLDNLQLITQRENILKDSKTNFIGAYSKKTKSGKVRWYSRIKIDGKDRYLGTYDTEIEAHKSYINKLSELKHI
jgi:hypothetical protein